MTRTEKENLVPVWERITICSWNHADKPDGHFKDIRPLFADIGILRMAIANTNTRGPSLEKMRTSLPIMVPELLP